MQTDFFGKINIKQAFLVINVQKQMLLIKKENQWDVSLEKPVNNSQETKIESG